MSWVKNHPYFYLSLLAVALTLAYAVIKMVTK